MDTNRAEKVLTEFEREVKNIVQISALIKSVEQLNQGLSTVVTEQNESSRRLDGAAEKLIPLAGEIISTIESNESTLRNGLSSVVEGLKNGLAEHLSALQAQSAVLEQLLKAELHLALTRYETFVRGELISIKERIELNSKDTQQKNSEGFREVAELMSITTANLNKKISFLLILAVVSILPIGYLLYFALH